MKRNEKKKIYFCAATTTKMFKMWCRHLSLVKSFMKKKECSITDHRFTWSTRNWNKNQNYWSFISFFICTLLPGHSENENLQYNWTSQFIMTVSTVLWIEFGFFFSLLSARIVIFFLFFFLTFVCVGNAVNAKRCVRPSS